MEISDELGIYSEVPFLERIINAINSIMWILFLNPISFILSDIIWIILAAIIISSNLRSYSNSSFFGIMVVFILTIFALIYGCLILGKFIVLPFIRIVFGEPIFKKLGGMDRATFFTSMNCSHAIKFEFRNEDLDIVQEFNKFDAEFTEEILKNEYRKILAESSTKEDMKFESKWSKIWNEQILELRTKDGFKFKDALSEDKFAFRVIPLYLVGTSTLIAPLIKSFQLIMVYLIMLFLNGSVEFLTVLQVGVTLSFGISIIWFIFHSNKLSEIELLTNIEDFPEVGKEKFSDEIEKFRDKKIRPMKITMKKNYFSLIRDYLLKIILVTIPNTITLLIFVGITLIIGFLWFPDFFNNMLQWYQNFSIALLLIPFGFIIGYYLTFIFLQYIKRVLAPIVFGLSVVILPYVLLYLFTGNFEINDMMNNALGFLSGILLLLISAVTSKIIKVFEEDVDVSYS